MPEAMPDLLLENVKGKRIAAYEIDRDWVNWIKLLFDDGSSLHLEAWAIHADESGLSWKFESLGADK